MLYLFDGFRALWYTCPEQESRHMSIANRILGFFKALFRALTLSSLACLTGFAGCGTEVYDLYIDVNVPRVYDNANSLGYRRYQRQRLQGVLYADADGVRITGLYNRKHTVGGVHVRYTFLVDKLYCSGENRFFADGVVIVNAASAEGASILSKITEFPERP